MLPSTDALVMNLPLDDGTGTVAFDQLQTGGYQNLPEAQAFYASGNPVTPSVLALNHSTDRINAIVLGDLYRGDALPTE